MQVTDFFFPVGARKTMVFNGENEVIDMYNSDTFIQPNVKSIVRLDTNEYISTVGEDYKIITNEELLTKTLSQLDDLGYQYVIDDSHCFKSNAKMKLCLRFPEITVQDDKSESDFTMYIHNSYNREEGIRLFMGFIRLICTNGMIAGKLLGKYYHRHTKGANLETIGETVQESLENIPNVQERIKELQNTPIEVNKELETNLITEYGPKMAEVVVKAITDNYSKQITKYVLMNALTWYISHHVAQQQRTRYQLAVAREFGL